jgi:hypothetical protein
MMKITCLAAALLATAAPATAAGATGTAPGVRTEQPAEKESSKKADNFDPAQLFAMFDKLFPPQPDPPPARLALSKVTVQGLFPNGSYARMMDGMIAGLADRVLNMSEADFEKKGKDGRPPSTLTLRQSLAKDDPAFEERYKIIARVLGEEMVKVGAIVEPKMREGLARSMAHRFDEKQLTDLNAFLATDSGRAFGQQSLAMWFDADVVRGMFASFPELITVLPGIAARIESETAHLPKPKKKAEATPQMERKPQKER